MDIFWPLGHFVFICPIPCTIFGRRGSTNSLSDHSSDKASPIPHRFQNWCLTQAWPARATHSSDTELDETHNPIRAKIQAYVLPARFETEIIQFLEPFWELSQLRVWTKIPFFCSLSELSGIFWIFFFLSIATKSILSGKKRLTDSPRLNGYLFYFIFFSSKDWLSQTFFCAVFRT